MSGMKAMINTFALYNWDDTLFDNMILPQALNKNDIVDNILLRTSDFSVTITDHNYLKLAIGLWSRHRVDIWEHLLETTQYEYNPIENYDRHDSEVEVIDYTGTGSRKGDGDDDVTTYDLTETGSGTDGRTEETTRTLTAEEEKTNSGTDTTRNTGTDTVTNSGKDTTSNSGADTVTDSGTDTVTNTGTDTVTNSGKDTTTNKGSDTVTDSGTDTVTNSGTDTVTNSGTDGKTKTATDILQNSGSDSYSETNGNTHTKTGTDTVTEKVRAFNSNADTVHTITDTAHNTTDGDSGSKSSSTTFGKREAHDISESESISHGHVEATQHGHVEATQHGKQETTLHGHVQELEHGHVEATLHGHVEATQHGKQETTLHGHVQELEHGHVEATQHGHIEALEHGHVEDLNRVDEETELRELSGTSSDTNSKTGTETFTHSAGEIETRNFTDTHDVTRYMHGNIGVTTTQEMIEQERKIADFDVIDIIVNDYIKEFCVMIY